MTLLLASKEISPSFRVYDILWVPFPLDFLPIISIWPISPNCLTWVPAHGHKSRESPIFTILKLLTEAGNKSIFVLSGGIMALISARVICWSLTAWFSSIKSFRENGKPKLGANQWERKWEEEEEKQNRKVQMAHFKSNLKPMIQSSLSHTKGVY